jgi:acylphosphatase
MVKTIKCKIKGKVQGVFFRRFCQIEADNLNLRGWVENLADGSVLVLAHGEENNLLILIDKLKIGPTGAKVEDININWNDKIIKNNSFVIK